MIRIDEILIQGKPGHAVAALRRHGDLVGLEFDEPDAGAAVGDIFLARVGKIVPSIQAAFLDLGAGDDGFLGLADARPANIALTPPHGDRLQAYVREGEPVAVQVLRGAAPGKGPKLTTRLTVPGSFLVLAPGADRVMVSKKIHDTAERQRLTALVEALRQPGEGWVVRTQCAGVAAAHLEADLFGLRDRYAEILAEADDVSPPKRLHGEGALLPRLMREALMAAPRRIVVDDAGLRATLRGWFETRMPGLVDRLTLHGAGTSLFAAEGVADQIEMALNPEVHLPGGGTLVIEPTTALVAIDVNTGTARHGDPAATALAVNLEAAQAVARQLRLRNLSGLIVVDFVSMRESAHQGKVLTALRRAVEDDPLKVQVAGYTTLGLVEMTRPRRQMSLEERVDHWPEMLSNG